MTDKPHFNELRELDDQVDVHLRLDDGLVHRVHADYASMTACDKRLVIEGDSEWEVNATWESWQTNDPLTCLECLTEWDKQPMYGFAAHEEEGIAIINTRAISKIDFDL